MNLVFIADAYPPMKTSGAVQIRDLVAEFVKQGHGVTLLLPDANIRDDWQLNDHGKLQILRLKSPETKNVSYVRRAIAEYMLSGQIFRHLQKSPLKNMQWDAIVWYSPTIFFGKLVQKLKARSACPAYLILRDIFPEWAVDMGLLGKGLIYRYFKSFEKLQYRQADIIGVQTPSNTQYFLSEHKDLDARVEVLPNWLSESAAAESSIRITATKLSGRQIFVYTGNIGIAQGMDILIELAREYRDEPSSGFLFVGRGTAVERIKKLAASYQLENILFYDEIPPEEIPGLLDQCHVGLIALDPRHRNDNIPGKFLAYMQAGLPVLATINPGNDLEAMIREHQVGEVVTDNSLKSLVAAAGQVIEAPERDAEMPARCKTLCSEKFSASSAVKQIVASLENVKH